MPTLTSTGAVNLTSSTNWSPALVPTTGDDLIINGAHTLTLDADLTLNSVTLNNANAKLAYSGTTRSVQATNGWLVGNGQNLAGAIFTNTLAAGDSLTLTGPWSSGASNGNFGSNGIISATGGSLTLRTVGSDPAAVLFPNPPVVASTRIITSSWSGGTLTTIGRFDLTSWNNGNILVTMSGGTWTHQSTGTNSLGPGPHRLCSMTGTATVNWTGSVDSQSNVAGGSVFSMASSSTSHTIGQSGDIFLLRSSTTNANFTALLSIASGVVELVGQFSARLDGHVIYMTGGTVHWRNQSRSIPSTDHCFIYCLAGTINLTGLVLSNAGKFVLAEVGSSSTTVSAGTSITCTSAAATASAIGTTALDGRIVVLESSPATLPTNAQVASGVSYGYSGAPQVGTGLIMDPATLATAMLTSFSSLPEVMTRTTIATLASQTEFTLAAGSTDNDVYNSANGTVAIITDQSTSVQKAVVAISDYVGSTRTVTLSAAPGFTIATGDLITIIAGAAGGGGGGLDAAGVRAAIGMAAANLDTQLAAIDDFLDTEVADIKAKTDLIPADIGSVLIAANSNREVMVTGSKHVAADVHEFQPDVIDSDALASSAVSEIQNGLATAANQVIIIDGIGYTLAQVQGAVASPQTSTPVYATSFNGATYTVTHTGVTSAGVRGTATRSKT